MSVINKMLRDLDARAGAQDAPEAAAQASVVTRGTASVAGQQEQRTVRTANPRTVVVYSLLLSCLLAAVAWWVGAPPGQFRKAPDPPVLAVVRAPETTLVPVVAPIATVAPPAPASSAAPSAATPMALLPLQSDVLPKAVGTARPAVIAAPRAGATGLATLAVPPAMPPKSVPPDAVMATVTRQVESPARYTAPAEPVSGLTQPVAPRPSTSMPPAATSPPWQDAAMETVAQAQRLWNSGSRDAAIDLLRESLLLLERSPALEVAGPGAAATLTTVRELVRMEIAQGQLAAVLAMLRRHERLLAGQADLWAVRANAAQRIGQHAEASQAYQMALKIRPGEPRWMLGAAVSLAAQGQTVSAAALVEQARTLQVVSPEVLAYLRQLGVTVREN